MVEKGVRMKVSTWNNCYDMQWRGMIVPEAFSHPAKYAPGLIDRIFKHGLAQEYWRAWDLIGDPFGGIAGGGIAAAYNKLAWIGCELEPRFVDLGNQNIAMHRATWEANGFSVPVLVQGDSRRFSDVVLSAGIVTSPPYADSFTTEADDPTSPRLSESARRKLSKSDLSGRNYGTTPGQIGALKAGDLGAVVTSPPYADSVNSESNGIDWGKAKTDGGTKSHQSPGKQLLSQRYGVNPANIGNLKIAGCVTSPPFENSLTSKDDKFNAVARPGRTDQKSDYGTEQGQIGNDTGESYWQAMRQVYAECHKAMKPGGCMAVVIKAYVKNKRKVHLPQQTLRLLIHLGFEPVERVKAMLVKEDVQPGLFGEDVVKSKSRKSFFRRLAEKNGSPRIDWEEVLFVRKPNN